MQRRLLHLARLSGSVARQQLQQAAAREALLQHGSEQCSSVSRYAVRSCNRFMHSGSSVAFLPPLARRVACGPLSAGARQRWQQFSATQQQQVERLSDKWSWLEAKLITVVNSFSLTPAGQAIVAALLPVTVCAALFPGRHRGYAYELPHGSQPVHLYPALTPPPRYLLNPSGPILRVLGRISEELAIALRGLYLMALFAPAILSAPLVFYYGLGRESWVQLLRWTLEQAGPAFIKWGQWASSRPDLFPKDVCLSLEALQSNAPAHSGSYSRQAVQAAFGRPLHEVFSAWEDAPLASGSIAQIHRACLAPGAAASCGQQPGTLVAVKVRHPGVSVIMARDFVLMQRAAAATQQVPSLKHLRLDESIRQFGGPLQEQLDLSMEAAHLSRFGHNFRRWRSVKFPTPIYPLVRPDVLVESFEPGAAINGYVAGSRPCLANERMKGAIAETGLNAYLQMLLKDNFIHADMHPGNILIREVEHSSSWVNQAVAAVAEQVEHRLGPLLGLVPRVVGSSSSSGLRPATPQLVLLDTGMIAELSKVDQNNVVEFFRALTKKDGEQVAWAILNMSERHTCPDPDRFVSSLKDMFDALDPEFVRAYTSEVLQDMIEQLRQHQVTLKSTVSTVVVTTLVLEGWSSRLNPDLKIMDTLKDMLASDWKERLSHAVDKVMASGSLAVV